MDEDRRQSEQDGSGAAPDNVVRLPCHWLDAPDELVPIGRSPRSTEADGGVDVPPAAEDFWGEASAAVQDALQAPAGYGQDLRRGPDDPSATSSVAMAGASAEAPVRIRGRVGHDRVRLRPLRLPTPRRTAVAIGAIACLALVASIIGFASPGRPGQNPVRRTANAPTATGGQVLDRALAASIKAIARGTQRATHRVETSLRARRHRVIAHHKRASRHHGRHAPGTGSDTRQTFVSSPTPPTTTPPPQQSSATGSGNTAGASSASASQTPSASANTPPPGPTGPVALIGAGTSPSG